MNNALRIGNFTSSEIAALMSKDRSGKGKGKPYFTYIDEKNMERKLGKSVRVDTPALVRAFSWGQLLEKNVFDLLGGDYHYCSDQTLTHPMIDYWVGSPDGFNTNDPTAVAEVKCPITLKSFCALVNAWNKGGIGEVRKAHPAGEKYFWQIVSNACITKAMYGELIVYCPYKHELEKIKELASSAAEVGFTEAKWIFWAQDNELPYIPEGGHYKNLNVMRFEVTYAMKAALHMTVEEAGKELIERHSLQPAA
jgi:hypothetical protein